MIGLTVVGCYFRSVKLMTNILILLALGSFAFGEAIISGFSGYEDDGRIIIQWTTAMENGVTGFEIQRSTDQGRAYHQVGFLHAQGRGSGYTFIDDSIIAKVSGREYTYRLKIRDANGESQFTDSINVETVLSVQQTWGSLKALFK